MSKGVKLVGVHSKSKNKQYSSFYNFATIRSNEIRANINRIMCSTNKRINTLITGIKDNVNLTVTRGINISGTLGVWTYDFSIGYFLMPREMLEYNIASLGESQLLQHLVYLQLDIQQLLMPQIYLSWRMKEIMLVVL